MFTISLKLNIFVYLSVVHFYYVRKSRIKPHAMLIRFSELQKTGLGSVKKYKMLKEAGRPMPSGGVNL